jgi:hypothetical protein
METSYTEEEIETILDTLLSRLEEYPDEFNEFETRFLEDVEDVNEESHLTRVGIGGGKSQLQVLVEIHEEHCGPVR